MKQSSNLHPHVLYVHRHTYNVYHTCTYVCKAVPQHLEPPSPLCPWGEQPGWWIALMSVSVALSTILYCRRHKPCRTDVFLLFVNVILFFSMLCFCTSCLLPSFLLIMFCMYVYSTYVCVTLSLSAPISASVVPSPLLSHNFRQHSSVSYDHQFGSGGFLVYRYMLV